MTLVSSPRARRYTLQGVLGVAVIALILAVILGDTADDAQARPHAASSSKQASPPESSPESPAELDPAVYSHARALCAGVALTHADLAAMDLTQSQAEAVLDRLALWCTTHESQLATAGRAVNRAERDLSEVGRELRTGVAPAGRANDVAGLRDALVQAREAKQALYLQGGLDAMQAVPAKAEDWQQAAGFVSELPVPLRHLTTMTESRLESARLSAVQQGVPLEEALSFSERTELQTIRQRVASRLPGVRAAAEAAMPSPEALDDGVLPGSPAE